MKITKKSLSTLPFDEIILFILCLAALWGMVVWMVFCSYLGVIEQNRKAPQITAAMKNETFYGLRCGKRFLPKGKFSLVKTEEEIFVPIKTFPFLQEREITVYNILFNKKFLNPKDCDPVIGNSWAQESLKKKQGS